MSDYNDTLDTASLAGDLLKIHSRYTPPQRVYVTYYSVDGSEAQTKVRLYNESDLSIIMPSVDFNGFKCWLISGQEYLAGQVFYDETSANVSAMMSCCGEYTLRYDSNGGYGKIPSDTQQYNRYVTEAPGGRAIIDDYGKTNLAICTMSKSQYKFKAWLVNNEEYPARAEITLSDDMKALAVWESAPDYRLTVKSNNIAYGTVSDSSGIYQKGTTVTITAAPQVGCKFRQWSDGDKNPTRTITILGDTTLTAEFYLYGYVVTFEGNGGVPLQQTMIVERGTAIGKMPTAEKANFYFIGWFTQPTNGEQIKEDRMINAAVTFYAQYLRKVIRLKTVGQLAIEGNDVVSGFSNSSYLVSYTKDDYLNFANGLDFVIRAKTGSTLDNQEVFGMAVPNSNLEFGCYNNKFMWEIATGSVTTGTTPAASNTWYWFKVHKDASMKYDCYIKTDNASDYTLDISRTRNQKTYGAMMFGNDVNALSEYWRGTIDIGSSYMLIHGFKVTFEIIDESMQYIVDHEQNNFIDHEKNILVAK